MARREGWRRRGRLLEGPPAAAWAASHAALPAVAAQTAAGFDLYVSPRDADRRAHVARMPVRVGPDGPRVAGAAEVVLAPGPLGAFDESGVTVSCVVEHEGSVFLYYTGWTLGVTVPFYFYAGLAISRDGGATFARASPSPLLERDEHDPFLTASPFVLVDEGRWRMWYVSCVGWDPRPDAPRHRYLVKYAESDDGVHWRREGRVVLPLEAPDEYAISRPWVIRDRDRYRMWFSSRGDAYRLGYAESADGLAWRRDAAGALLEPAEQGWDSEMIAYPCVFDRGDERWLLYNGNGYGRSGVGLATAARPAG